MYYKTFNLKNLLFNKNKNTIFNIYGVKKLIVIMITLCYYDNNNPSGENNEIQKISCNNNNDKLFSHKLHACGMPRQSK